MVNNCYNQDILAIMHPVTQTEACVGLYVEWPLSDFNKKYDLSTNFINIFLYRLS